MGQSWNVLVPVKELSSAKSRLSRSADRRRRLATAMALDTLAAVTACEQVEQVWVVTSDPSVATHVSTLDVVRQRQPVMVQEHTRSSLNAALVLGLDAIAERPPGPVAIVAADLPAARSQDLDHALTEALLVPVGVVPDAEEVGTTMLTASAGPRLEPQFGEGSLVRHLAAGATTVPADRRLRLDVDTPQDLRRAVALGVGQNTMRCLLSLRE